MKLLLLLLCYPVSVFLIYVWRGFFYFKLPILESIMKQIFKLYSFYILYKIIFVCVHVNGTDTNEFSIRIVNFYKIVVYFGKRDMQDENCRLVILTKLKRKIYGFTQLSSVSYFLAKYWCNFGPNPDGEMNWLTISVTRSCCCFVNIGFSVRRYSAIVSTNCGNGNFGKS